MSERLAIYWRGQREARCIRRYAASCRLGRRRQAGLRAELKDQPGVRTVFALDSRLQQDTLVIGDFPLCRLLLSNDADFDRVDAVRAESDAILVGARTVRRGRLC